MKRINHNGFPGYSGEHMGTKFVVFNGSFNTNSDWNIDITESEHHFGEMFLDVTFTSKKMAVAYLQKLIEKFTNQ